MNTDFRIDIGFPRNAKKRRLQRQLRAAGGDPIDSLITLWGYVTEQHPKGEIAMDDDDIEAVANWTGEAGAFAKALLEGRWLDRLPGKNGGKPRYKLHDWGEHQPWVTGEPERKEDGRRGAHIKHHVLKGKPQPDSCPFCKEEIGTLIAGAQGGLQRPLFDPDAPTPSPSPSPTPTPAPVAEEREREKAAATTRARAGGAGMNPSWFMAYAYRRRKFDEKARNSPLPDLRDPKSARYREDFFEFVGIWPETFDAMQMEFVRQYGPAFCADYQHDLDLSTGRCKRCPYWQPTPEAS